MIHKYTFVQNIQNTNIHLGTRIPQGVPEFKVRNQIAAGFESILFWWVTINKNVDWINYIYYNQHKD